VKRIFQFGYAKGAPAGVPLVDCRRIPNPFRLAESEREPFVRSHPLFPVIVAEALRLLSEADAIGIGCTYGVHRSGVVAREVAARLSERGITASIERYDPGG
jgi:RNase adaptor protein for sRNA GlmZ degradation